VLLGSRIREGLAIRDLAPEARHAVAGLVADGLVDPGRALRGRLVLTRAGRLLADAVVRALTT
ncbi:MAG: coproporphyrinogen III oxidase, partial [Microbacterium sp.]